MKILYISHYFYPHVGGVETHTLEVARNLIKKGHKVSVITKKFSRDLENQDNSEGIDIYRINFSSKRYKGLISIWKWLWKNRNLIKDADIIHCHDVFIWYLPFKFIFPNKKVVTTMHGWEGVYPIPFKNILLKRLAAKLSDKVVAVGKYIGKYYGIKADKIIYGGASPHTDKIHKTKGTLVFLGRLERDTGILEFLKWAKKNKKYTIDFIGDGRFRDKCARYGRVLGVIDPTPFLERAEYCVPGGYLSFIRAKTLRCKIITFAHNDLKKDYWKEIEKVKKFPTWEKITNEYISMYNSLK